MFRLTKQCQSLYQDVIHSVQDVVPKQPSRNADTDSQTLSSCQKSSYPKFLGHKTTVDKT